jgi:antitoxin FitA
LEVLTSTIIPEIHAVGLTTRKAHGEAAEAAFLAKATNLGFGVARVWGDSERYDFIADSGSRLWRIQVKSTARFVDSHYVVKCRGNNRRYATGEIDFLAVYIVPEDLWYVVPISIAEQHDQIYFFPRRPASRGICEIYREAWCQLACPRNPNHPNLLLLDRQPDYRFDACKLCNLKCGTPPTPNVSAIGHVDMRSPRTYADQVPKTIQVRNVPNALHRRLKARACAAGKSLSDYLLAEIEETDERPTLAEFRKRLHRREPVNVEIDSARLVREQRGPLR